VSTQLRLVEPPAPKGGSGARKATRPASRRGARRLGGRSVPAARRRARWAADWHLDATTRRAGQRGVAAAKAALAAAQRPDAA
jgi:hypothetical protein